MGVEYFANESVITPDPITVPIVNSEILNQFIHRLHTRRIWNLYLEWFK